jgi:DNA primase
LKAPDKDHFMEKGEFMFKITDLDPMKLQDWQVAEEAEKHMKTVFQLAELVGIKGDELIPRRG